MDMLVQKKESATSLREKSIFSCVHRWVMKNCREWTPSCSCTVWFNENIAIWMNFCSKSSKINIIVFSSTRKCFGRIFLSNLLEVSSITHMDPILTFSKTTRFESKLALSKSSWMCQFSFFRFVGSNTLSYETYSKPGRLWSTQA